MPTGRLKSRLVPSLHVWDIGKTGVFYEKLGFSIPGSYSDVRSHNWIKTLHDGVTLQFHSEPPRGTPSEPVCSSTFYFFPQSVAELPGECRDRVEFGWGPEIMSYGMSKFGVQDSNGDYFAFTEPA